MNSDYMRAKLQRNIEPYFLLYFMASNDKLSVLAVTASDFRS